MNAALMTASNKFNPGMHVDISEPVRFKFSTTTDTNNFYILILVGVTLTCIKSHEDGGRAKQRGDGGKRVGGTVEGEQKKAKTSVPPKS